MSVEATLARRAARSTRTGAAVFAAVAAMTVAATALSYVTTFPTAASRRSLQSLTDGGVGVSVLFGSTAGIGTVGGYTFYKGFAFLTAIAAVWAVLTTTRALRGEEDAGRWHLLAAGATRPSRVTAATLVGLVGPVLLVAVGVGVGTAIAGADRRVGFGGDDVAAHAAAVGVVPLVFVGVGAVASQLARTRRAAAGIALAAVGVAFAVRMVADAGPATRWLRWATPFGWSELVAPMTANRWFPVLVAVIAAALLGAAAVVGAARRDVGSGLIGRSDHAPTDPRGLGSTWGFALRCERGAVVAWWIGAAALGAAFGVVAHISTASLPASAQDLLRRFGVSGSLGDQYVGVVMIFVAAVLALLPAGHVAAAAAEEEDGRLAILLAGPPRRSVWLAQRLVIAAGAVVVAAAITGVAMWAAARLSGTDLGLGTVVTAAVDVVPVCLVALGVGAVCLGVAPRAAAASVYVLIGWSLVADIAASLVDGVRWIGRLGLLHYLTPYPSQPLDGRTLAVTTVVAVALAGAGVALHGRRDVTTG